MGVCKDRHYLGPYLFSAGFSCIKNDEGYHP